MDEIELATFSLGDVTKRRCKRCKREFVGEEEWETRCYYHPGVWKEPTSDDPGWSCCRNSLMPITDFKEFFAYQESVEVPNLKDMLDEYAAKSLQQFRSVLERQRMISGPSSDTQPLLQDHPTSRSPPPKRKYNPALAAYDYKEYNQTMSRNETFTHRDDPLLSPLSRTSVGCKIADCHILDEDFAKALQSYPLVHSPTEYQPRPALPAEIVEQRLGKPVNPHTDTNMFGKLLLTNTPHREPLALPLPQQPQLPVEPTEIQNEATFQQEAEEDKDDQEEVPPYFIHYVQTTDTLVGLSLRYKVSVDEIHRANFLTGGHQICHRQTLKIPTHGRRIGKQVIQPATPAEVIRDFRRRAPECSSNSEAKFYLEETNYVIVAALERFHEDAKWEKTNATKFQPKTMTSQKPKPETSPGFSFGSMFASLLCQLRAE